MRRKLVYFLCWFLVALTLGCAKMGLNSYDEITISNSRWMPIGYQGDEVVYFAPDRTEYSNDGTVTTIIFAREPSGTKRRAPAKLNINCTQSLVRTSYLDAKGNWYDGKNWEKQSASPVIQNLCYRIPNVNETLRFIASIKVASNPNQYQVFLWEPNKNYASPENNIRTYQMYFKNTKIGTWNKYFAYVDCNSRTLAVDVKPNATSLQWQLVNQDGSVNAYIMGSVCPYGQTTHDASRNVNEKHLTQTATAATQKSPAYRTVQVNVESTPNGATVKDVKSGQTVGVTPFVVNYNLDITKLKAGRCYQISALSFEWISGAKAKTSNPYKICMHAADRFSISMQRPKTPGIQADIDYQIKLQQLKIQQETLAAQQRQAAAAEQQARAQQEQAAAEANQAKSAQDALLLQMFQGGSMIKKSPTRLPINCSPTVSGEYSCY